MKLEIDFDAITKELTAKRNAALPDPKVRCIQELSTVLDPSMTLQNFVGFIMVLADKHAYVRDSLATVTLEEVLGARDMPKAKAKGAPKNRSKASSSSVDLIIEALKGVDGKLPKSEILAMVRAKHPDLSEAQLGTLWTNARASLASEGRGPKTCYGLR